MYKKLVFLIREMQMQSSRRDFQPSDWKRPEVWLSPAARGRGETPAEWTGRDMGQRHLLGQAALPFDPVTQPQDCACHSERCVRCALGHLSGRVL